jgi:hypothetical protein
MKRLCVLMLLVAAAGCSEEIEKLGIIDSSPTTYASLRIAGPTEVRVGESVQYRSYARLLGANAESETTTVVFWTASPEGRLTLGLNGAAVGATEGTTTLSAIIAGGTATITVTVVAAAAPPTTPTPPPTTPTSEVRVTCPPTITPGEVGTCSAVYVVNGVETPVTDLAFWSSSASGVASVNNHRVTGVSVGTAFITAIHEASSGRAQVTVVLGADGRLATQFVPVVNNCGIPIRTTLTGSMLVDGSTGFLIVGDATQNYVLTFSQGADGRIRITGQSSANGFDYSLDVTQAEAGGKLFTGREDIRGPGGCTAQYTVTMDRTPSGTS